MSRFASVAFDLDDTLCRHDGDVDALYRRAFERAGVEPFGEPDELWAALDGPPDPDDRVGYLGAGFARLAAQHDRDVDPLALAAAFEAVADGSQVAYLPAATDALAAAAAAGPVGVLTNGPEHRQRAKVEALGLGDRVDAVVYAGDLPRRKPHAEPFERMAAALSVEPSEMLYVGNSLGHDVAGAHNAGLRSAWLRADPDDAPAPYRPDYVCDSLAEVAALLADGTGSETDEPDGGTNGARGDAVDPGIDAGGKEPVSDAVRAQALAATRPGAIPVRVERLDRGNRKRTEVVRFETADPVVVQYAEALEATGTEAALLAAVDARTEVPVPRPLGEGVVDGTGWMVTPLIEGRDLHAAFVDLSPRERRGVAGAFGRYLAALHEAFRFADCGRVTADRETGDEATDAVAAEWRGASLSVRDPTATAAWVREFGERHAARLPAEFDDLRERLREALRGPIETDGEPRLFPWDFRPGNALVADGAVAAVLDWEAPLAAPRGVSVAKAEHLVVDWYVPRDETEPLRRAFRGGYESVAPLPPVPRAHRAAAVASAVVDSVGVVTNPRYPPVDRDAAVEFHRRALRRALGGTSE